MNYTLRTYQEEATGAAAGEVLLCSECGKPMVFSDYHHYWRSKKLGRSYHKECAHKQADRESSVRMTSNNPMHDSTVRKRMSQSLRKIGHRPLVRGGNGRGMSKPEEILLKALGGDWVFGLAVPTKIPRGNGYPTNYKVDIANEKMKIAVEVDGNSHFSRKDQDQKKTKLLESLGWKVLRFQNKEVIQDISTVKKQITNIYNPRG